MAGSSKRTDGSPLGVAGEWRVPLGFLLGAVRGSNRMAVKQAVLGFIPGGLLAIDQVSRSGGIFKCGWSAENNSVRVIDYTSVAGVVLVSSSNAGRNIDVDGQTCLTLPTTTAHEGHQLPETRPRGRRAIHGSNDAKRFLVKTNLCPGPAARDHCCFRGS